MENECERDRDEGDGGTYIDPSLGASAAKGSASIDGSIEIEGILKVRLSLIVPGEITTNLVHFHFPIHRHLHPLKGMIP